MTRTSRQGDRGAAAVEMAIVFPILVVLVFGIIEFGRAWFIQASLAGAAREGARSVAIHHDISVAQAAAVAAAPGLGLSTADVAVSTDCSAAGTASVTVSTNFTFMTGFFGTGFVLSGTGAMRCGG